MTNGNSIPIGDAPVTKSLQAQGHVQERPPADADTGPVTTVGHLLDLLAGHGRESVVALHIVEGRDGEGYGAPVLMHEPWAYMKSARQCEGRDRDLMLLTFPLAPRPGFPATVGQIVDILTRHDSHRVVVLEVMGEGDDERLLLYKPTILPGEDRVIDGENRRILDIRFGYEEL